MEVVEDVVLSAPQPLRWTLRFGAHLAQALREGVSLRSAPFRLRGGGTAVLTFNARDYGAEVALDVAAPAALVARLSVQARGGREGWRSPAGCEGRWKVPAGALASDVGTLRLCCTVRATGGVRTLLASAVEAPDEVAQLRALSEAMLRLRRSEVGGDAVFAVGPAAKQVVAHRAVLAERCPAMRAEFFGALAAAPGAAVSLPGTSPAAFDVFLNFLYGGRIPDATPDVLAEALGLALRYELPGLCALVCSSLEAAMCPATACLTYECACLAGCEQLRATALEYACRHRAAVVAQTRGPIPRASVEAVIE